jgi:hypothetical protein
MTGKDTTSCGAHSLGLEEFMCNSEIQSLGGALQSRGPKGGVVVGQQFEN